MKKVFFAAILATIAIGGAYAQDYYVLNAPSGSSPTIHCTNGLSDCETGTGIQNGYNNPLPNQGPAIPLNTRPFDL